MAVKAVPFCTSKSMAVALKAVSQTLMLNCSSFSSAVQPESKPEEVSVQKDVKGHTFPPVSVCPVSAAKPPRTNSTSSPTNTSAAPAVAVQVRPSAGMEPGTWGALPQVCRRSTWDLLSALCHSCGFSTHCVCSWGRVEEYGVVILVCKHCSSPLVLKEPRKLSYAEVCQKPPKEPPPVPVQPLRELRTNIVPPAKADDGGTAERASEKAPDKAEGRMKDYCGIRGSGAPRGAAGKIREQRRQFGRRSSPQGAPRRVGKEQYVPPRSPK